MNLNTKRFLAAVLGICAGTAALLGVGEVSASNFSRYLLANDVDKSTAATSDADRDAKAAAATSSEGRVLKTTEEPSRSMRILKVEEGTALDEDRELIYLNQQRHRVLSRERRALPRVMSSDESGKSWPISISTLSLLVETAPLEAYTYFNWNFPTALV